MELIGIDYQLKQLDEYIRGVHNVKAAILFGPQGTGKTSSVYFIAKKHKLDVIEFNASFDRTVDFIRRKIKPLLTTPSLIKSIILFDEFENVPKGVQNELTKYLKLAVNPVVFTTNDISTIIDPIQKISLRIRYTTPDLRTLVQYVKRRRIDIDFTILKDIRDFRQLKHVLEFGSMGYEAESSKKDRILKAMRTGNYCDLEPDDYSTLMDMSEKMEGVELWEFVSGLAACDLWKRPYGLNGFKKPVVDSDYVNYFKKGRR